MYEQGSWYPYQIVFISFVFIVGSGILILVVLHTYLMLANLTTCNHKYIKGKSSDGKRFTICSI